jgi:hypothetical protein
MEKIFSILRGVSEAITPERDQPINNGNALLKNKKSIAIYFHHNEKKL